MDPNSYSASYDASTNLSPDAAAGLGLIFGGMMIFLLFFVLLIYIYMAVCLMKMAKKTNTENAWFAWIPILNVILMLQIAKKPLWWILLMFIPLVNIVVSIMVWMEISKALGKPDWLGILMIVPVANLIIPGYLAFSNSGSAPAAPQTPVSV
jgi:hypothetical protein